MVQQAEEPMDDLSDEQRAASQTALSILSADPALGPVEVRYIAGDEPVRDPRYLIILFGEKGFLFDHIAGRTTVIPLSDGGRTGDERHAALIESAKQAAVREKLGTVYVVRR